MFDPSQSERDLEQALGRANRSPAGTSLWTSIRSRPPSVFRPVPGSIVRLQELPFQIAVARACNDHFAAEYNALSDRVKCVGVLPMRSPQAAAEELERAVKERGIIGFEILPSGLPVALGDSF